MQINEFGDILKRHGMLDGSGVPCSIFKPLVNAMTLDSDLAYLPATSEGEAVAIAAGLVTAGRPAFALMQNSGLGNAVNPITSLIYIYRIPVMFFVSHRGEPGGKPDEPQHELMGQITEELAKLCRLETHIFEDRTFVETLASALSRKVASAWVCRTGALEGGQSIKPKVMSIQTKNSSSAKVQSFEAEMTREQTLQELLPWINQGSKLPAVVSTTGKLSRELFELDDRDHSRANRFYMVGSMGCAAPFGLGIAQAEMSKSRKQGKQPRRVVVLDGDGAVLMKMGALGTIGMANPANFHHLVFDNGSYESTGGQPTASPFVDFNSVALACGYRRADTVSSRSDLQRALKDHLSSDGPTFLRILIRSGSRSDLGRPNLKPRDGFIRFSSFLSKDE
jgi:phosphonopyruvate decarboxylase